MTAVIGMLNKQGAAVAADSAVTRTRGANQKVTKNGNKMVRVSDVVPICVMITGNAMFLRNPWDIIVRKFRKERGNIPFPTVEAAVKGLIDYLCQTESLWNPLNEGRWMTEQVDYFMNKLFWNLDSEATAVDDDGKLVSPTAFVEEVLHGLGTAQDFYACANQGFKDYDFEKFAGLVSTHLEIYLNDEEDFFNTELKQGVKDYMALIKDELLRGLYAYFTSIKGDDGATLIFTGYGKNEIYPSLVAIDINEGFDRHVNWTIKKTVHIDDETPAAICPFAQTDVIEALLSGASASWLNRMEDNMNGLYTPSAIIGEELTMEELDGLDGPDGVMVEGLFNHRIQSIRMIRRANRDRWVKDLEEYDVKSMAELALTLIDLTGLQRILAFKQEGVGGDVDLAVITKTEGFTWLSRKSWYHHKDINGRYGSMGV